jgi:hypothetical protein
MPRPALLTKPTHHVMRSFLFLFVTSCFSLVSSSEQQIVMDSPQYQASNGPNLADILTVERSVSIFYSYARETKFSKLLDDSSQNITILAPTNRAVIALPQKPYAFLVSGVLSPADTQQSPGTR